MYAMSSGASCVPETRSPRKPGWKLTCTVELCCGSRAMPLMSSEKGEAASRESVSASGETLVSVSSCTCSPMGTWSG